MGRDLAILGQVLIGFGRLVQVAQRNHVLGTYTGDTQDIDHGERTKASADGHERHVVDRDSVADEVVIGPGWFGHESIADVAATTSWWRVVSRRNDFSWLLLHQSPNRICCVLS